MLFIYLVTYAMSMVAPSLSQVMVGGRPCRSRPLAPQYNVTEFPATTLRSLGVITKRGDTPWYVAAETTKQILVIYLIKQHINFM